MKNYNLIAENILDSYGLDQTQKNTMQKYLEYLLQENEKFNLTAVKTYQEGVWIHLIDSLEASKLTMLRQARVLLDIGSGAGLPGIPLAIIFPEKQFLLMEVVGKRIGFLKQCIEKFNLHNCQVVEYDFKTYVRKKREKVDCFLTRASLPFDELLLYKGGSKYSASGLIYWASDEFSTEQYERENSSLQFFCSHYELNNRKRKYICVNYKK